MYVVKAETRIYPKIYGKEKQRGISSKIRVPMTEKLRNAFLKAYRPKDKDMFPTKRREKRKL